MRKENVEAAIRIMQQAENLDMTWFQNANISGGFRYATHSIDELHACGNSACFAGYVALSKEFQDDGGGVLAGGRPVYRRGSNSIHGHSAIAEFLGISDELATLLVYGEPDDAEGPEDEAFYGKSFESVTPEDVIEKLEMILSGELA